MNIEIGETHKLRRSSRKRSRVHHEDDYSTSRKSLKARKIQQEEAQDLRMHMSSSEERDRKEDRNIFYQDFKCAICLEIVTDPHIIPECCHRFCGPCINESIKARYNECPACRQHISTKRSLRKDALFGKLLDRLQQLEKENEDLRSKLEMNEDKNLPLNQPFSSDDENENESDQHSVEISRTDSVDHDDNMENESDEEWQSEPVVTAIGRHESGNKFEEHLADLQRFKNEHGHCNVPFKYEKNKSLGYRCNKIRQMKSSSRKNVGVYKLTDDRITKLEEMGFQWKVSKGGLSKKFEERLAELQRFKNEHGHCNVPRKYEENPSLGSWCVTIKQMKSGSKRNVGVYKLTDERIAKLKEMGFRWKSGNQFEDRFADLQRFKNEHGHCNVPYRYEKDKSLGRWCVTIRQMKSGSKSNVGVYKLTDDRVAKLEEMGFWLC
ncbi:hypothetical protein CTEN210_14994 [Chaetoceros tenuissimus]|uniref:RING-type domain-containing protein n=1 Tax=Chaetoceros tenuissimus TaxID=426638 RepID=A0AAD3HCY4_9STRA|nr:hypothetical protein CTEN210_14994 [Chaetoceros tenuissimus]